jgi:phage FluMu protein Com
MILIRCECGWTWGKVDGKYEFICPKCKRKNTGSTN